MGMLRNLLSEIVAGLMAHRVPFLVAELGSDPQTRYRIWFEIEAHAADAMADLGIIPKAAAKLDGRKGRIGNFTLLGMVGFLGSQYRVAHAPRAPT
jgi:hypothetical protein